MKEYLSQNHIPFEDRNVRENEAYMDELQKLGSSAVPTVKIGDEVVIGARKNKLTEVLQEKGLL